MIAYVQERAFSYWLAPFALLASAASEAYAADRGAGRFSCC